MSFEKMLDEESFNLEKLAVGAQVEATVSFIRGKDVVFVHDDFFTGSLPVSDFWKKPSVGDEIQVFISDLDDGFGNATYDHRDGMRSLVLEKLSDEIDNHGVVTAKIVSESRAGLNLLVGGYIDAFMPKKQVSVEYIENFEHLIGTEVEAKILSFDELHENLILSRRALLVDDEDGGLDTLDYGVVYDCIVTNVARFGLFVNVGGLTGLIHVSDLDWNLSKANLSNYNRGDKIKAMAKFISEDSSGMKRFFLSIKHLDNSPWEKAISELAVRSCHDFEIFKIESDTGNILGCVNGVCAMIPSKEIGWTATLLSNFHVGQIIPVTIEYMDNKLGFETVVASLKNTQKNPWVEILDKFNVGDVIDTTITKIFSGEMLFVRLVDGVDAIVYPADIDWVKPSEKMETLSVGDCVKVKITQINKAKKKLTASMKDVIDDPFKELVRGFKIKGTIKTIAKNGTVFLDINHNEYLFNGVIENKVIRKDISTAEAIKNKKVGDLVDCVIIRMESNSIFVKCC